MRLKWAEQGQEEFYEKLFEVVSAINDKESLFLCGDLNGHVGQRVEGFEGVHGGFGFGSRNSEGEMILEFAESLSLSIANTWFKKEDKLLVSYDSGGNRSVVDYVLVRAGERTMIRDAKVITNEPYISQHKLMICIIDWKDKSPKHKKVFVSKCRIWKLKDTEKREEFKTKMQSRAMTQLSDEASVEDLWQDLRE